MQEVTFVVNLIIFFVSAFVLCNYTIKAKQKIFERIKENSFKRSKIRAELLGL